MVLASLRQHVKKRLLERWGISQSPSPFLPATLARHLPQSRPVVLLDVGAHEGEFTKAVADYCGIEKAVLVEPISERAKRLQREFADDCFSVYEFVAAEKTGLVRFEVNEGFDATSSMLSIRRDLPEFSAVPLGETRVLERPAETIDNLISSAGLSRVDLIKIDVQGSEHRVLLGASDTLKNAHMIWIEVSFKQLYVGAKTFPHIFQILNEADFMLVELHPGFRSPQGELLQADALFVHR